MRGSPPKLVLLDGNGLVYRAFYALPYFTTSDGRPTNAVYGFTNMLLKVLEEERPTHLAVAFDRPAPTFRHEDFAAYKATRPVMPDDLRSQMRLVKEVVDAFGVVSFEVEGYEADDVIATLVRQAEGAGFRVVVVTGDLDLLQVASDRTTVVVTSRGISETTAYDREAVRRRFGLEPEQLPDFKALRGDPTDNLPGVPGVGEKTAAELVRQFGSVEALLDRLDQAPPKLQARLRDHAGLVLQNKRLATVVRDVPVAADWKALEVRPYQRDRVVELFRDLEFKSLLERLGVGAVHERGRYERAGPEAWERFRSVREVAVSLDATGKPMEGAIRGVALSDRPGHAVYVAVQDGFPQTVAALLESDHIRKISQDAKADLVRLRRAGLVPRGFDFDVGIASYVLNPGRRSHDLATVAWEQIGWRLAEPEGDLLNGREAWERRCEEADALQRVAPRLRAALREREVEGVYRDIEMPLVPVLADMEMAGVAVDVPYLQDLAQELRARLEVLAAEVYGLAGMEFNLSSPKQLAFVLFEKLGLPPLKKTKTGYSTDADVLETLALHHPVVAKILQHRELAKLLSTYVEVLPRLVHPQTGRVHTTFNQTVAATGRLSSQDPNLQNIPIRTEEGRRIRRAFVAPRGRVLLSADYNQIELRLLAHISGDPALQEVFRTGRDIHAEVAAEVFGLSRDQLTPELRRRAKAINFGIAYGISGFGLSQQIGSTPAEADAYIQRYFARYPGVREYVRRTVEQARRTGYVSTLLGRRRYLTDLHSRNRVVREAAERVAINTPIQGSQADLIKLAMIRIHREVLPRFPGALMILQVHDELVFELDPDQARPLGYQVAEVMANVLPLSVPIQVELRVGPNWNDLEHLGTVSSTVPAAGGAPT
ncbi:MAG: DNA polymerase I [Armatimonadota bacterium]|nr:DNA polymerase I [Armatimonadota bacterium]MDR7393660.1 DNA polymerase I [Armatimonadota bacterium]MDR7396030.1 DNA polymerase I [Armatimonadota bacterium]MDR7399515.1 DNA polymerase I [Armatimonadota bacterium]MDR7407134.1 DNA polymerase I [Armatimonadota bacterium]